MSQVINATKDDLNKLYGGSAYTVIGVGGDINEWLDGYEKLLGKEGIGKPKQWYKFSGKLFNNHYNTNFFEDKMVFLAFPLDGLHVGKLAMLKLQLGDRWFDDVVDNLTNNQYEDIDEFEDLD